MGENTTPTVLEIVEARLTADGYDGLFNVAGECACKIGELAPCDGLVTECRAGYLSLVPSDGDDPDAYECDWWIGSAKPSTESGGMSDMKTLLTDMADMHALYGEIAQELRSAEAKFPGWPAHLSDGVMIVLEEAGEVAKAAVDARWGRAYMRDVRAELVQTAAMAIRMIGAIDSGHIESEPPENTADSAPEGGPFERNGG